MKVWFGYSVAAPDTGRQHPLELVAFAHESEAVAWQQEWDFLRDNGVLKDGALRVVQEIKVEGCDNRSAIPYSADELIQVRK